MRTTLSIDDDVLGAARELAVMQNATVGEVISALARRGNLLRSTTVWSPMLWSTVRVRCM